MEHIKTISDEIFEDYLNCKYKSYLRIHNHVGDKTEFEIFQQHLDNIFYSNARKKLERGFYAIDILSIPTLKPSDLEENKALILETSVELDSLRSFFNGLRRYPKEIESSTFFYEPVLYCRYEKLTHINKLILSFKAIVIGHLQNQMIDRGIVIHGKDLSIKTIKLQPYMSSVDNIIDDLKSQFDSSDGIPLILNPHCDICEFRASCQRKALKDDNLSLLRGISEKEIHKHNQRGIFTVNQLSYTFRPRKIPKRAKNPSQPHYYALQALSLRENTIYIHGAPKLPTADTMVYFDIEGVPYRNLYYLIGLIISSRNGIHHRYYWADSDQDQQNIFSDFVQNVSQIDNCRFFHFGGYDTRALKRMKSKINEDLYGPLEIILEKSVNVLSIVYSHLYFPTYSHSLKDIGRVLGCQWKDRDASGLQSIIWRETWEENQDPNLREKLIQYNKDDCLALKTICDFISNADSLEKNDIIRDGLVLAVSDTDELKCSDRKRYVFRKQEFAFSDLEHVNKCAYFDYQREKVFIRTNKEFKKINRRRHQKNIWTTYKYKPNKTKTVHSERCLSCGSKDLENGDEIARLSIDIRFFKGGVKKWITQYQSWHYKCHQCKKHFIAKSIPPYKERYGHGLISWCVYINVARKQSMLQVGHILRDVLDLHIEPTKLHRFKSSIAKYYKPTYEDILSEILKGPIIHIDETRVNLRKKKGYVWVITNMDKVYYFYKESRKGHFLKEFLEPFSGVLISDLYSAYDSIDNPQQKCLVHLIRDMNEDLKQNPFDNEFKGILERFSILLRRIIDTVDRFGLKKRYLHKHKKMVNGFLADLLNQEFASGIAEKYKKRFKKSGKKFFTFLDYDGVPWNNNNAENAISFFAKHRRFADGRFTERSLKEFLLILSVIQTCEFNQVNVLKFLLSKEKSIKDFLSQ